MKQEQNDRKHLTPRQIINRYRKGEYIDENIESISSAVSSCNQAFDSVSVPFPISIIEKVYENIGLAKVMYECQITGRDTTDIAVPDYPQLKEILFDLSYPPLWESMASVKIDLAYLEIMNERGLIRKYNMDNSSTNAIQVASYMDLYYWTYWETIQNLGLSSTILESILLSMINDKATDNDKV